jgi:anti-repressor protein
VNTEPARGDITAFRHPRTGQDIRIVDIDGEPWFVAADVAGILDLGNVHSSVALLDDDEKGLHTMETLRGPQSLVVVSEPGLYSLILRSRKAEAKAFKRWVTHEVLPSIRHTGSYSAGAITRRELAELVIAEADRADAAEVRAAELASAAAAWGVLAEATGDYSLRDAAHILNRDPAISTGQNGLMRFLRDEGLVDRKSIPYARYSAYLVERPVSYAHPRTGEPKLTHQIRITVSGLEYVRKRLGGVGQEIA